MSRITPEREAEIIAAVRNGDENGLTRESVAKSLGMSPPALCRFLRARGLTNARSHRDGKSLAIKLVKLAKERGNKLDALAKYIGTSAGHLQRIAAGRRNASEQLVANMMQHLYGFSYFTSAAEMARRQQIREQLEQLEKSQIHKERAIITRAEKAAARERAMHDAIDDNVTPADVADRRYHGSNA